MEVSYVILQVPFVDVRVDASLESLLFFVTKRHWPACQFYRKASNIINVTLISGIIMIPMIVVRTDVLQYPRLDDASLAPLLHDVWIECRACSRFFPHYATDRASNLVFVRPHICAQLVAVGDALDDLLPASGVRDGGIRLCERHLWFSSNDLEYYETGGFGRELESPFAYEIACHGLLLNRHFMQVSNASAAHRSQSIAYVRRVCACARCTRASQPIAQLECAASAHAHDVRAPLSRSHCTRVCACAAE